MYSQLLKPRWLMLIPVALLLVIIAVACGEDATATPRPTSIPTTAPTATTAPTPTAIPTPTPAPQVDQPIRGGIVQMTGVANPNGWDPHRWGRSEDIAMNGLVYNQLVEMDPLSPSEIIGDLAKGWGITDDGLGYVFDLVEGVKWTDGQDFTADDVVFSLNRLMDPDIPKSKSGKFANQVDRVEKIDSLTVKVHMKFPAASFVPFLAVDFNKMLPQHVLEAGLDINAFSTDVVGTGPFRRTGFTEGVSSEYVRHPDYFKEGRPYFDGIKMFIIEDEGREIGAFKTEQILMSAVPFVLMTVETVDRLRQDQGFMSKYDFYTAKETASENIQLNHNKPPFDDDNLRRALYLATDRQELTDFFGKGTWTVAYVMASNNPYALPAEEFADTPGFRYVDGKKHPDDIAEAVKLFNEAGYTEANPLKVEILTITFGFFPEFAQVLKVQYERDLPIEMTVTVLDTASAIDRFVAHDFEMGAFGAGHTIFDPDAHFSLVYLEKGGRNFSGWHDPEIDDLFFKQQKEIDPAKRRELNDQLQRLVVTKAPAVIEWTWVNFIYPVHKSIRTGAGPYVPQGSLYTRLKHEHEWLDPECAACP